MGTGDSGNQVSDTALVLIEEQAEQSIRRVWHDDRWYFSVIDRKARRKLWGFSPSSEAGMRGLSHKSGCPTDFALPGWNTHV